jgi:transposase
MRKIRDVLRLVSQGYSQRAVSNSLGVSRTSVSEYLLRASSAGLSWPIDESINDFELENMLFPQGSVRVKHTQQPDWQFVLEEMQKKGSTREALHAEYLALNPNGMSYSNFCTNFRAYKKTLNKSMKQIHTAGEKVFVDFSGPTMHYLDRLTGERKDVQIFVGVLGASYYLYAKAVMNQKIDSWLDAHASMFEHFGGVPEMVVCDNLKAAVTKATRNNPEIHPSYLDFASHYDTIVFPAKPYSPQEKSKAEGGVLIFQRWVMFKLRKLTFYSLDELNQAITELVEKANNRNFQKLSGTRYSRFIEFDKPALKPLNQERYVFKRFLKKRVALDYHVEYESHFYSVPHALVTKEVELVISSTTIEIIFAGSRVASHARTYGEGKTTIEEHMLPTHRFYAKWDMDSQLDWALSIGKYTHQFVQTILTGAKNHDVAFRIANSVKQLVNEYDAEKLEMACERAVEIGASNATNLKQILKNSYHASKGILVPSSLYSKFPLY